MNEPKHEYHCRIKDLADVILGMTWGDLMEAAKELAECCRDKDARPMDDIDFARLLHDWAQTNAE